MKSDPNAEPYSSSTLSTIGMLVTTTGVRTSLSGRAGGFSGMESVDPSSRCSVIRVVQHPHRRYHRRRRDRVHLSDPDHWRGWHPETRVRRNLRFAAPARVSHAIRTRFPNRIQCASENATCLTNPLLHEYRLSSPVLQADLAESCVVAGDKRPLAQLPTEVARARVGYDAAPIVEFAEVHTDQFIETELLRTGHFNGAIQGGTDRDPADRFRDVVGGHWLNKHGWHSNRRSDSGFIGHALHKFEELRCVNNRVRDCSILDQGLLSVLRSEVWTVGYTFGSYD